jgi:hypothetical protein
MARSLARWIREKGTARKAVIIVQDFVRVGSESIWHTVPVNNGNIMHFVGHFRATSTTDRRLTFTKIDFKHPRQSRIAHVRVLNLSIPDSDAKIPPRTSVDIRLEFALDPAPGWTGEQHLELCLTDNVGVTRKVKAVFRPLPAAPTTTVAPP